MKKLLIIVLVIAMAIGIKSQLTFEKLLPDGASECEFYISGEGEDIQGFEKNYIGNMTIYSGNFENIGIKDNLKGKIMGVSAKFKHSVTTPQKILDSLSAKIIKIEKVEDMICYYAYSGLLKNDVEVDNKKINIQLIYKSTELIVGYPMIMGSY